MIQPYDRAAKEFAEHPVLTAEVPVEHFVSEPPLPTLRWSRPAYAVFACPATRIPGQPLELDKPDRWCAIGADHGRLLAYALVRVIPFAESIPEGPVTVRSTGRPLSAVREDRRLLGELLTDAVPAFFSGDDGDAAVRADLAEMLGQVLPREAMPWYVALTPDFFGWLER